MKRTTIFAEEALLQSLKQIAREEGISVAELTRQALTNLIAERQKGRKTLSFLAVGNSGRGDVAAQSEELLWKNPAAAKRPL